MRYNEKKILKYAQDGKPVLQTIIFRPIPKRSDDIYIITQESDRLDLLANQFYQDPTLWWIICHANDMVVADIGVEPGIQLRIPRDKFSVLNSI